MISEKTKASVIKSDAKLDKADDFKRCDLQSYVDTLLSAKEIEIGYRSQCGATHRTQRVYREFIKIIELLKKDGYNISEEIVKHKNAYATINQGFWNSKIFRINEK